MKEKIKNFIKNVNDWLDEHAWLPSDGKYGPFVCILVAILTAIIITVFTATGHNGDDLIFLLGVLYLGIPALPPVLAALRTLFTKRKWEPNYWFSIVIGIVFGSLISIIIGLVGGWAHF